MDVNLSEKDRKEIARLREGFPWMDIVAPATAGRGIRILDSETLSRAVEKAENAMAGKPSAESGRRYSFAKFVPASGAASRMFKDLFRKDAACMDKFVSNIDKFAFFDAGLYAGKSPEEIVDLTLGEPGLGYGSKPKGVLEFHRYPSETRTAIAEHLVEGAEYMKDADGTVHIVVTISPEHQELFDSAIAAVRDKYAERYGVRYEIKTVFQYKWTDTVAITSDGDPFLKDDGTLLRRPGGHGALIHNLNEIDSDVVSIKNIDNVSVEKYLPVTSDWKKALIGTALDIRERIDGYIARLSSASDEGFMKEIEDFLKEELCIGVPDSYDGKDIGERKAVLLSLLDRPVRVCGMVKNEGEPGGGPFIVREKDGGTSLQILEGAQINPDDRHAQDCLKSSTHFNPVDIVCVLTDASGKHYDLLEYVDDNAGFISSKSYQGRELKALELPGLWNGAMSRWNTVFVEVPAETFNPVKTVLDLLRPAHQGGGR